MAYIVAKTRTLRQQLSTARRAILLGALAARMGLDTAHRRVRDAVTITTTTNMLGLSPKHVLCAAAPNLCL